MVSEEKKITTGSSGREGGPDRIVLTGFRGTGKSLIGIRLAEQLGFDFIDTDDMICAGLQCSLSDFVRDKGWHAFRKAERQLLAKLVHTRNVVIATGGGAIMHHDMWQELRQGGLVVWLQAEAGTIRRRLEQDESSVSQRPSLTGNSLSGEVEEVLALREPYYAQGSDLTIDTTNMSPEEITVHITKILTGGEIE